MNILLIVDPQYDFIHGTLPVPGAEEAMERLAKVLPRMDIDHIIITMDAHTIDHCSFVEQGGLWPAHCVKYSPGAAIDKGVFEALVKRVQAAGTPIHYMEKAVSQDRDEYSAFAENYPALMDQAETIYVAGIAGDVCVHTSVNDLIAHGLAPKMCVILDACPSLDGGGKLSELVEKQSLRHTSTTSF
ncbi:isochorismatase family protein [Porphyromonas sp.]|uniref:isochorismatase family protein n=1 Tax=Porphyromonas sp. TaxID=1924944 RepID=UPI0026DC5109|nr:isochorismatase family protein [Porphyromonas sp.]MDO4770387.1 isochorismatase family protein [Porphyromonas sp.]